jgi:hypothetical protein
VDQLKEAIGKTIRYGRKFKVKYGYKEIKERLISNKKYMDEEIELKLREIKWPKINETRDAFLINKVNKAKKLGELLANRFSNILLMGITGSVAAGYPKENEDIDLIIITRKDSLWITRLAVRVWTWINKTPLRKYGKGQNKDDFCLNLWLEDDSLKLPSNRQNLRNAMDLILMKPVVNKYKIYERFIEENGWAKKYVATGYGEKITNYKLRITNEKQKTKIIIKIINRLVFWLQYAYMISKLTNETVDIKTAFFHPINRK